MFVTEVTGTMFVCTGVLSTLHTRTCGVGVTVTWTGTTATAPATDPHAIVSGPSHVMPTWL